PQLPVGRLERLAARGPDREHLRSRVRRDRFPLLLGRDVDERAGGRIELLAADRERGAAGEDDVQLLVAAGLLVLGDDLLPRPAGPEVDAERLDPEVVADGDEVVELLDLLDSGC